MQPPPITPGTTEDQLRQALAAAPASTLGRVVGILDSLAARGAADALLAAARPRLRTMQPPRPLRFTRLLALPLEPALVSATDWPRAAGEIPRAALTPLAEAMRHAVGDLAEEIDVAALGRTMADGPLVERLGSRLWPRAAVVPLPALPSAWHAAGLPAEAAPAILGMCRALWRARYPS
jgi:hypothetical protein